MSRDKKVKPLKDQSKKDQGKVDSGNLSGISPGNKPLTVPADNIVKGDMIRPIKVSGARVHNLKNVSVSIPSGKLVVMSGISGSGKSSLAFDTIFAEWQRRYVESLSSYARQFLGQIDKPDVDSIEGLSPAVAIDQKSSSKNPRSTVGTVTEVYDHLRLLYARIGISHCPKCGSACLAQSLDQIVDTIYKRFMDKKIILLAPLVKSRKGSFEDLFDTLKGEGFSKVRVDGVFMELGEMRLLDKKYKHDIELVIDRISVKGESRGRLSESCESGLKRSGGLIEVFVSDTNESFIASEKLGCAKCSISIESLEPRSFSFNSPFGACEECHGLGVSMEPDVDSIVPDPELTLNQGAVAPWGSTAAYGGYFASVLSEVLREFKISLDTPWKELPKKAQKVILYGKDFSVDYVYKNRYGRTRRVTSGFEGVIGYIARKYQETESDGSRDFYASFMKEADCKACKGARLKPEALAVKINGFNIFDICSLSIDKALLVLQGWKLDEKESMIAERVIKEVVARLGFLLDVGLEYLTLHRSAATLSGGEAQRIRLATQVGSGLVGVLYVLDEPSIGLHQKDNTRLLNTLFKLRDLGNSVLVVEHDEETIFASDWVVDVGPGAGENGGEIVYSGPVEGLLDCEKSITGSYLAKKISISEERERRVGSRWVKIVGARENNLKSVNVDIPLGVFTSITGVSGSGKSSLINGVLYPALARECNGSKIATGKVAKILGINQVDKVVYVDQSPIGKTPRSNPATYTGLFDHIRTLFSMTNEAIVKGFGPGRFSFNVKGGRCESCSGDGSIRIEMNFLPDVYIACSECKGKRYNKETLSVLYKGFSISDVLEMSIESALKVFEKVPALERQLKVLNDVGLGYLRLGHPAPWLSGGEAQRIKLASELCKRSTGKTFYLLDEPTTGLHFEDVRKLVLALNKLVEGGNTVLVIEHNLDVIAASDYIVDLGPGGGVNGGEIIAKGTPEEVSLVKGSFTGEYLLKHFRG
jgi:excinuclease ABC subunit A